MLYCLYNKAEVVDVACKMVLQRCKHPALLIDYREA